MTKTKTKEVGTKEQIVKRLVIGDRVLFDGDMEVDFDPYFQIKVVVI